MFRLGAEVTAVDAREDHLNLISKKHPGLKTIKLDLDKEWFFVNQKFDLILDLGLLCHLMDYQKHLKDICHSTTHLVLETAVCDSDSDKVFTYPENKGIYDWSVNGFGCRPSPAAIEKILKANKMNYFRCDTNRLNTDIYKYDWSQKNNDEHSNEKRRLWFAQKNQQTSLLTNRNYSRPQPIASTNIPVQLSPSITSSTIPPKPFTKNNKIQNTKLKVAVCISGFLRTFEQTFESLFVNLTDQFNCDFFIHTWEMLGAHERHFDYKVSNLNVKNIESKIKNIYNPKQFIIEPRKQFHINEMVRYKSFGRDAAGLLSMYYKIQECNKLKIAYEKQYNFQYDLVFRYRPDMLIQSKIIIDPNLDINPIYIPASGDYGGINDQFAFSNSNNMNVYSSLFENITDYLGEGQILNPEYLLKYHFQKMKLPLARFNCNYVLKRPDGSSLNNGILERQLSFIK
jgi:hypothetical protein